MASFCTFVAGSQGKTRDICNTDHAAAILKMNECHICNDWVNCNLCFKMPSFANLTKILFVRKVQSFYANHLTNLIISNFNYSHFLPK